MTGDITLFLCGDVMTGRGIDQILLHPNRPFLMEPYVRDARKYVALAEEANGPVPKPADPGYIWGDTLAELDRRGPDVRIVNLETAVTTCDDFWPGKGINYRMHPANVPCLTAARIDCCALANNHVLDWGKLRAVRAARPDQSGSHPAVPDAELSVRLHPQTVSGCGYFAVGIPFPLQAEQDKWGRGGLASGQKQQKFTVMAHISAEVGQAGGYLPDRHGATSQWRRDVGRRG